MSDFITKDELLTALGISARTLRRRIAEGIFPKPSFGKKGSHSPVWHKSVLETYAVSRSCKVLGENMRIMFLGGRDTAMTQKPGDFNNRFAGKQKLRSEKMSQGMKSTAGHTGLKKRLANLII